MDSNPQNTVRRTFLKSALAAAVGTALPAAMGRAKAFSRDALQVWSCGGLAEAFMPANDRYEQLHRIKISYTGAFAAALGKSLLGSATTEIFGGRVLDLAKKLKSSGKMLYFKPLCFTSYVMVTPSPPGGQAVQVLLKKAGIIDSATKNCVLPGSCVQRTMDHIIGGKGDVSVMSAPSLECMAFLWRTAEPMLYYFV